MTFHCGNERPDELASESGQIRSQRVITDLLHDRASNDDGIGHPRDLAGLFGGRNSEADRDWQLRMAADPGYAIPQRCRDVALDARDPFTRDVVDESCRPTADLPAAFWRRSRRNQANVQRSVSCKRRLFLRGKVKDQESIDSCLARFAVKLFESKLKDWIQIRVENDRNLRLFANLPDTIKNALDGRPGFECPLCGELIHQAVGQWIGERNAELKNVHAGFFQGESEIDR